MHVFRQAYTGNIAPDIGSKMAVYSPVLALVLDIGRLFSKGRGKQTRRPAEVSGRGCTTQNMTYNTVE